MLQGIVLFVNTVLLNTIVTLLAVGDMKLKLYCWQSMDGMK